MNTYKVQRGDTPTKIAQKFGQVPSAAFNLVSANRHKPLRPHSTYGVTFQSLAEGEELNVPEGWLGFSFSDVANVATGGIYGGVTSAVSNYSGGGGSTATNEAQPSSMYCTQDQDKKGYQNYKVSDNPLKYVCCKPGYKPDSTGKCAPTGACSDYMMNAGYKSYDVKTAFGTKSICCQPGYHGGFNASGTAICIADNIKIPNRAASGGAFPSAGGAAANPVIFAAPPVGSASSGGGAYYNRGAPSPNMNAPSNAFPGQGSTNQAAPPVEVTPSPDQTATSTSTNQPSPDQTNQSNLAVITCGPNQIKVDGQCVDTKVLQQEATAPEQNKPLIYAGFLAGGAAVGGIAGKLIAGTSPDATKKALIGAGIGVAAGGIAAYFMTKPQS